MLTLFSVCLLCVFDRGVGGGAGVAGSFARAANGGRRQCCRCAPDGWWHCGASRLPSGRGGWAPDVGHRDGRSVYDAHRHGARCVRSRPRATNRRPRCFLLHEGRLVGSPCRKTHRKIRRIHETWL